MLSNRQELCIEKKIWREVYGNFGEPSISRGSILIRGTFKLP